MADLQDAELYDEFGNYIGPDLDDDDDDESESDSEESDDEEEQDEASDVSLQGSVEGASNEMQLGSTEAASAIVLHEDKNVYPSASQVYGENVRTAVLDEDAMELEVPIVEPVQTKSWAMPSGEDATADQQPVPDLVSDSYLTQTLWSNETTLHKRGVALVGQLHSGKTTLVDLLLEQTKAQPDALGPAAAWEAHHQNDATATSKHNTPLRWTDSLKAEQERHMSIQSTPITLPLPDTRGKTFLCTLMDCPGHANFHDESVACMAAADGVVLVVDAVEGITTMMHAEMVVRQAVRSGLPITLLINKIDRLLLELKLPPEDCYYKLMHTIDSVNALISSLLKKYPKLSPDRGNVVFASALHGWSFTLNSMAEMYVDHCWDDQVGLGHNLSSPELAKRLWGDCFLCEESGTFHRRARDCANPSTKRTFCQFILGPIYKIYSAALGESEDDAAKTLRSVGVLLSKEQLRSSARPLMRAAFKRFFGNSTGFVDMLVQHMYVYK
eukprot:scaffold16416_cov52-Attheya_sp.AAC.5